MLVNEHVYQMDAHVRCFLIQLEEAAIISLSQCFPNLEGMNYTRIFLLLGSQLLHHPKCLHLHAAEDLVKNLVCEEFNKVAFNLLLVHVMQLCLALIELVKVSHLKCNPRMCLVYLHGERVLDSLDSQVLAHRSELLIDVPVVSLASSTFCSSVSAITAAPLQA